MQEEWRDIKGYEGLYQVSSNGRVKSLARVVIYNDGREIPIKERILKQNTNKHGYLMVGLSKECKTKTIPVHKLVAISFLNHTPNGHNVVCDHINNIRTDNRLENLQLISQRENASKDRKGASRYIGVSWNSHSNKWRAAIRIKGKKKHLGLFTNEIEAYRVYQSALAAI